MSYISKWRLQNNSVVPVGSNLFGTCNSSSSDTTKVVSLSAFNVLVEGVTIHVYFANANSGSNTLLKVGSTSAQPIKRNGVAEGKWESGSVISFTYSQGYWVQNDADVGGGTITDVTVDGTSIVNDGVAELETVTQLRDGLMTATDKQKLDGVASGAEVNVNADWSAVSGDALILNKPTIPTDLSDLNNDMNVSDFPNDAGYITGYTETDPTVPSWAKASSKPSYTFSEIGSKPTTLSGYGITDAKIASGTITLGSNTITPLTSFTETDPVFTAHVAHGITSTDISNWNEGKLSLDTSAASGTTDGDLYAAIVALGWENDVIE